MDAREKRIRQRLKDDFEHYASRCLKITDKAGRLVPFALNRPQRLVHERLEAQRRDKGRVRALVLKARQWGCSTYVEGRFYWLVTHRKGCRAYILTHEQDATDNLFGMVERYHNNCPALVRPVTDAASAKELHFAYLDSGYGVGTARTRQGGRSQTIQLFHGSEVAHWPAADTHFAGVIQAVPEVEGTEIILESTAAGVGGPFYEHYRAAERGDSDYEAIFIPWYVHDEYQSPCPEGWVPPEAWLEYAELHELSPDQLHWAYVKNRTLARASHEPTTEPCWLFKQEYPATADEAFQSAGHNAFIKPACVIRARKAEFAIDTHAPIVLGVDAAGGGGDRTCFLDRQGRKAGGHVYRYLDTDDQMHIAGELAVEIERLKPLGLRQVFIDVTGGYGKGAYDRLCERGYSYLLTPVDFGARPIDDVQYANKRAEMYGRMNDWLNEVGGADIPDDDVLHSHIVAPGFRFNSSSRIVLEPKRANTKGTTTWGIKERLGFSPDGADALACTFAETVAVVNDTPPPLEDDYETPDGSWMGV